MRAHFLTATLVGLILWLPGCRNFDEPKEAPKADRRKVNLPDTPHLVKKEVRATVEDGAYTVAGLLASMPETLGNEVVVRGIVVDKVECPEEEPPEGAEGEADAGAVEPTEPAVPSGGCHPPPHLFLTDDLARPTQQLLVTGTALQIAAVSVAQPVELKGRVVQWSADKVFVRTEGLLQLEIPDEAPPAPEVPAPTEGVQ